MNLDRKRSDSKNHHSFRTTNHVCRIRGVGLLLASIWGLFGMLGSTTAEAASDVTLFTGGLYDLSGKVWAERSGTLAGDQTTISVSSGGKVLDPDNNYATVPGVQQVEAQRIGVLGADFTYSAYVTVSSSVDAHLQFRISDEGRYGVRLRPDGVVLYRFLRADKQCWSATTGFANHCPDWPPPQLCNPDQSIDACDSPQYSVLGISPAALAPGSEHLLAVAAQGLGFDVFLDGAPVVFTNTIPASTHIVDNTAVGPLSVGRFGLYVFGDPAHLSEVQFRNATATSDPTGRTNFALLYSTAGYEAVGTKRALVRTLNDVPAGTLNSSSSGFRLIAADHTVALQGPLNALPGPYLISPSGDTTKTFGMQLWEANFSTLTAPGTYTLAVDVVVGNNVMTLTSAPFPIADNLIGTQMLKPLTTLDAEARRAADDDLRRNWIIRYGNWSVGVDGAFIADRADPVQGALLDRVFNVGNDVLMDAKEFRLTGQITIVSGCDAQLQFWVTPVDRWGITIQGCSSVPGTGAVRLHHEGILNGVGFFNPLATVPLSSFQPGHRYNVEALVTGGSVSVWVDGALMLSNVQTGTGQGGFAVKAFASTARFERVQAWNANVPVSHAPNGAIVPLFPLSIFNPQLQLVFFGLVPCQYQSVYVGQSNRALGPSDQACTPLFSQLHGFDDCNNVIGEATSHGIFLAGLMDVWASRAYQMTQTDREALRKAIITTDLYLDELYQQANPYDAPNTLSVGGSAHQELGRVAVGPPSGIFNSLLSLYGSSAFADKGLYVDRSLARQACARSEQLALWLQKYDALDEFEASIAYAHIARCVAREGSVINATADGYWALALDAANHVIADLSSTGFIEKMTRDTLDSIPWLEGVYEVSQHITFGADQKLLLGEIADKLVNHITQRHPCTETDLSQGLCAPNAFYVLPQASCNSDSCRAWDWQKMDQVPESDPRPSPVNYLNWYDVTRFITTAQDMVYLGRLLGRDDLELIASGSLYWVTGLNPGIATSKIVNGFASGGVLGATSFVYNLSTLPFARSFDAYRTMESSAKGWAGPWETQSYSPAAPLPDYGSPLRETWWFDPLNNGFMSIVNGHMIWDNQWDYWNNGPAGWNSGETFLLNDGDFAKASVLYEDWLSPGETPPANPYATGRLAFFDTSHVDRFGTLWGFDDPVSTPWAQAGRAANDFCVDKGFDSGRFTGHFIGERLGDQCLSTLAQHFVATQNDINAVLTDGTAPDFTDDNTVPWALAARAATRICNNKGFAGGFFTGHQDTTMVNIVPRDLVCIPSADARWYDATQQDLYNSGYGFGDINSVAWDQAARAATNICLGKGYPGGFFTGEQILINGQIPSLQGVVCLVPGFSNTPVPLLDQVFSLAAGQQASGNFVVSPTLGAIHNLHIILGPYFSNVQLQLTRPDGTQVQPTDPGVTYTQTSNQTDITINNAPAGTWQYVISAIQLSSATENIRISITDQTTLGADNTPPVTTAALSGSQGRTGWYRSNVTVTLNATDNPGGWGVYGITYSASGAQTIPTSSALGATASFSITAEGLTTITFFATDNSWNVEPAKTLTIQVDKTPPNLAPAITPNPVLLNGTAIVTVNATDSISGVASATCGAIDTKSVGLKSLTCVATDNAGNSAQVVVNYQVIYRFDGFLQPINDTAHQQVCGSPCPVSIFKGGSTVSVKFQLKDVNGVVVRAASLPVWVTPQQGPAMNATIVTASAAAAAPDTNFRWDSTSQQYIYNWSTTGFAVGYYWKIGAQLDDGMIYYVSIGLK